MPKQITSALQRFVAAIREFTIAQRTLALIGLGVLVLGAAGLTMWAMKPSYTPLFSGLTAADANTIVEQLRSDNVPYELSNGGSTILVPEANVYDQRLKAASAGLPSSSNGGYSLLDDMGVTSSEFQQDVTYKRALEGELAATIQALNGVKTASVRLAIPEKTVFTSKENDPTASVFVDTDRGVSLSTEQVQAIVHLTSASIDGMKPSDVAVIAADGTVLSTVGIGATGTADKQASDYELRVRTAVQSMLDRVVGLGNATVVVAAEMNYESGQRIEETFTTPEGAPAMNESTNTEEYVGGGRAAAGVLGPDNIAVPAGDDANGTFNSEKTTKNNALNKVTETKDIPAGAINRQTVSVALNQAVAGNLNIPSITQLVSSAAGVNTDRGDQVAVQVVPFNTTAAADAQAAIDAAQKAAEAEQLAELIKTGIITGGIVLAFVLGLILYARRSRRLKKELAELELNAEPLTLTVAGPTAALPAELDPTPRAPELLDMERKRAQIEAMAQQDPAKTAEYFRGLMDDRQPV